ncbi:MAG: endonuclease [Bacteroidia bacterium]|nr:endonuclease [Bacteroidia bacterium]
MKKIYTFLCGICLFMNLSAQTTLPAFWSFVNPSPTEDSTLAPAGWKTRLNMVVTGTTPYTYATGSDGNAACRLDGAGEYVQVWFAEKPGPVSFYIKGTGISPAPSFAGAFKVQESIDGSVWTDLRTFTSLTGTFTRYVNTPSSASRYIRFFYAEKQSGSNIALDSILVAKPVAGLLAVINVKRGNTSLANGATYINGNVSSTVFQIKNGGTSQALAISSITLSGIDASDYSITNAPSSIAAGDSANFTLNFSAAKTGSSFASLTIHNNDSDNAGFNIKLYGIGGNYATQPSAQPTALSFTNLKSFTFTVNFTEPIQKPETYIVLRKKGSAVSEVPVDGQTYLRGDYIGGAQVAFIGSANTFKPTYILANSNYNFAVFACNGPTGYENYLTTNPLSGGTNTPAGNSGTYYNNINVLSTNFITMLAQRINTHDTVFYGNYTPTMINEFLTRDTSAGKKIVNCVYTSIPYIYTEPFIWWGNGSGGLLTREHTFAQSWMPSNQGNPSWPNAPGGSKELPEYNDQHHLFPANQTQGNNVRSNYPFGKVVTISSQNGTGKLGTDARGKTVYEPRDEQKGNTARALFYMCTAYNGIGGRNWSLSAINSGKQNDSILKVWHLQDPPDALEIARNEYINSIQHNRNPFIDHPEWVNYINFNNMTYTGDTTPVKIPSIKLVEPNTSSVWEKSKMVKIKWRFLNVDSVLIFFSSDSLKTMESIGAAIAANKDSISLLYNLSMKSANGIIIILDPKSGAADTSDYFSIVVSVALKEVLFDYSLQVYPNPVSAGMVTIKMNAAGHSQLRLYNIIGEQLIQAEFNDEATVDMVNHAPGIYFLQVINRGVTKTFKLVKE